MRSERFVLHNVFVIRICLFIPFLVITVLKNAVVYLTQKVYDFFQSKLKKLNEIHRVSTTLQQHMDPPVFKPYIKRQNQVPGNGCSQKITETGKGRRFQKTAQQTNRCIQKIKKNKSTSKKKTSAR